MAQVLEHLSSKYKALSSNPSTGKKKKKAKDSTDISLKTYKSVGST
jgi:hypothetical protein